MAFWPLRWRGFLPGGEALSHGARTRACFATGRTQAQCWPSAPSGPAASASASATAPSSIICRSATPPSSASPPASKANSPGPLPDLAGQTVILMDDGLATGSSVRAAIRGVRQNNPARVVVAVPTGARSTCDALRLEADDVVCASVPEPFHAVGQWHEDFSQTTDADVEALLRAAAAPDGPA